MRDISIDVPGRQGARRRRLPALPGRGPRADGRERRRQVHAHQGAHRRLRRSTPARSSSTGEERQLHGTADAQAAGISIVYQEVNLCTNLTIGENVMLGHEVRGRFGINWRATHAARDGGARQARPRRTSTPALPLSSLSIAMQQLVAISRAMVDRLEGAHPRRADLEPRRRRGRGSLRRHPPTPRPGRRDPVRLALPRSGLRDQRPHHRPAQRPVRRRVPHAPSSTAQLISKMIGKDLDAAPLDRRQPAHRGARPARDEPVARGEGLGRSGLDRAHRPRDPPRRGRRLRRPARLRAHRARASALWRRQARRGRGDAATASASTLNSPGRRTRPPHRVLDREPPRRGHHRRPHRAREHRCSPSRRERGWARPLSDARSRTRSSQRYIAELERPAGRPRTVRSRTSPAATSRRCCSDGGWRRSPSC